MKDELRSLMAFESIAKDVSSALNKAECNIRMEIKKLPKPNLATYPELLDKTLKELKKQEQIKDLSSKQKILYAQFYTNLVILNLK